MYLDVKHTIFQPGFTLLGLSASYGLSDRLTVYGTATNLTNVTYTDNATTSVASETLGLPRSVTGGMRWTL
jgi:outer membrane receptor protein involved in Fe transport